jgi:hypothetical protein
MTLQWIQEGRGWPPNKNLSIHLEPRTKLKKHLVEYENQ